jgi:putative glutamine amidotransferase
MSNALEINRRIEPFNPMLHRGQSERTERVWSVERVVAGALPVLSSFSAMQPIANIVSSCFVGRVKALNLRDALDQGSRPKILAKTLEMACFIGVLITTLISRSIGGALSILVQALQSLLQLFEALYKRDAKAILSALFAVLTSAVQAAALFYGASLGWFVLSGLMQVAGDVVGALREWQSGGIYEALMLLVAAVLRASSMAGPCCRLVRDLTSKKATAADVQRVVDKAKQIAADKLAKQAAEESSGTVIPMPRPPIEGTGGQPMAQDSITPVTDCVMSKPTAPVINLDQELRREGFSWHVKGIDLSGVNLSGVTVEGMLFDDCSMRWARLDDATIRQSEFRSCDLEQTSFARATLERVTFADSWLAGVSFAEGRLLQTAFKSNVVAKVHFSGAHLEQVQFAQNEMESVNFGRAHLEKVNFWQSRLVEANLSQAHLSQVKIEHSDLSNALLNHAVFDQVSIRATDLHESCFLESTVRHSQLDNCHGRDVLFCGTDADWKVGGCQFEQTGKPVVALGWAPEHPLNFGSLCYQALKDQGAVVLRYDFNGAGISDEQLSVEVSKGLQQFAEAGLPQGTMSRGQALVQRPQGLETARLVDQAKQVMRFSDALFLPGGMDIEPELYGHARQEETHTESSWRRSMMEMALLNESLEQKAPVMGVCRGMQMINVFHGGTLHQDARPFSGALHEITINPMLSEQMKQQVQAMGLPLEGLQGYSSHHQAVDQVGQPLEAVASGEGLVKAIVSQDGQFFGTQFHPEIFVQGGEGQLAEIKAHLLSPKLDLFDAIIANYIFGNPIPDLDWSKTQQAIEALRGPALESATKFLKATQSWKGLFSSYVGRARRHRERLNRGARVARRSA